MNVANYQNRVIEANAFVDYVSLVNSAYPSQVIQSNPFVGFKVLLADPNVNPNDPVAASNRLYAIDAGIPMVTHGKGIIVRETAPDKSMTGIWVISVPVPRFHIAQQIRNLFDVINAMEKRLGMQRVGLYEINVSGRFSGPDQYLMTNLMNAIGPVEQYRSMVIAPPPPNPYQYGSFKRISPEFAMVRTRWNLGQKDIKNHFDEVVAISAIISSIF